MTTRAAVKRKKKEHEQVVHVSNPQPFGIGAVVIREKPATRQEWKAQWMKENHATEADFDEHFNKPPEEMGVGPDGVFSLCLGPREDPPQPVDVARATSPSPSPRAGLQNAPSGPSWPRASKRKQRRPS